MNEYTRVDKNLKYLWCLRWYTVRWKGLPMWYVTHLKPPPGGSGLAQNKVCEDAQWYSVFTISTVLWQVMTGSLPDGTQEGVASISVTAIQVDERCKIYHIRFVLLLTTMHYGTYNPSVPSLLLHTSTVWQYKTYIREPKRLRCQNYLRSDYQ